VGEAKNEQHPWDVYDKVEREEIAVFGKGRSKHGRRPGHCRRFRPARVDVARGLGRVKVGFGDEITPHEFKRASGLATQRGGGEPALRETIAGPAGAEPGPERDGREPLGRCEAKGGWARWLYAGGSRMVMGASRAEEGAEETFFALCGGGVEPQRAMTIGGTTPNAASPKNPAASALCYCCSQFTSAVLGLRLCLESEPKAALSCCLRLSLNP
jgi:hypothetical protein